jgi:hypothetical protein
MIHLWSMHDPYNDTHTYIPVISMGGWTITIWWVNQMDALPLWVAGNTTIAWMQEKYVNRFFFVANSKIGTSFSSTYVFQLLLLNTRIPMEWGLESLYFISRVPSCTWASETEDESTTGPFSDIK